jgi:PAS domain S-box-containing protein
MKQENEDWDVEEKYRDCANRFSSIFNLTSTATKIINKDLKILRVNQALTDLLGYSAEEIEGTEIMEYACEEFKDHWKDLQKAMWVDGKPFFKLDACIVKKDKSLAWVHVTTILFQEEHVSYAFTVLDDFSYRKNFEESEKRLHMALQYSNMAVWELNLLDGNIIHSEGLDSIFGHNKNKNQWSKSFLLAQFLVEDQPRLEKMLDGLTGESTLDFDGRFQTPEGLIKWVNLQGKTEHGPDGKADRILGTIYDITKEKLAERHKDDFISIASHELRTPITALKASLQLMDKIKQSGNTKLANLVDQANRSMNKISLLIDDLLNASKMNEGQLQLKYTKFNVFAAIEECCHYVTAAGSFNIITEGDLDAEVVADSERIQQVVVNFVNNAMKYAPESKNIYIRVVKEESGLKISITDQGPGIPEEKIPFIFDRFYRADIYGGQYSGLGLGLYICAEIIKKHKGQIGVESELGKGSTFWFSLPCSK